MKFKQHYLHQNEPLGKLCMALNVSDEYAILPCLHSVAITYI